MIRRDYLIVGAGIAGASVCEGIREHDQKGSIMMVGNEGFAPYNRSLLLKDCLNGKPPVAESLQAQGLPWFEKNKVDVRLDTLVTHFNIERHLAVLSTGQTVEFRKACLAMGARARKPQVAGYNLGNVIYLRTLRDILALREMLELEREIVVVGGGYLATEALTALVGRPRLRLTLMHRGKGLWDKKLDPVTSEFLTSQFAAKGVKMQLGETVNGFEGRTVLKNIQTKSGNRFSADLAVVALGCEPNLALVQNTPLAYPHGTPVNELLETDEKGIYAVGDLAAYPCKIFGGVKRFENWDSAVTQGRLAGGNMTGKKRTKFEYVPFTSARALDLHFDLVGDFSRPPARFQLTGELQKKKFVLRYYQPSGLVGIALCNQLPAAVEAAKEELRTAPRSKAKEIPL